MTRLLLFAVAVLAWTPVGKASAETVARSQDLRPNSRIAKYMASPPSVERMYEAGLSTDRDLGRVCKQGPYNVEPIGFHIIRPVTLAKGSAHPDAGAWMARFRFSRCGEKFIYNAVMIARQGQPPTAGFFIPGETSADPVVFRDMKLQLEAISIIGASKAGKPCDNTATPKIENTTAPVVQSNVALPDGRRLQTVNEEIWTMRTCGVAVPVKVRFFIDPARPGVSFSMSLK